MFSLFSMAALTSRQFKCEVCDHFWDSSGKEQLLAFTTDMPRRRGSVCITDCLDAYSNPDRVDVYCDSCGRTSEALKSMRLKDLGPYVLVNIGRVVTHGSENPDTVTKNPAHIALPSSGIVRFKDGAADIPYEAIGMLKHQGTT